MAAVVEADGAAEAEQGAVVGRVGGVGAGVEPAAGEGEVEAVAERRRGAGQQHRRVGAGAAGDAGALAGGDVADEGFAHVPVDRGAGDVDRAGRARRQRQRLFGCRAGAAGQRAAGRLRSAPAAWPAPGCRAAARPETLAESVPKRRGAQATRRPSRSPIAVAAAPAVSFRRRPPSATLPAAGSIVAAAAAEDAEEVDVARRRAWPSTREPLPSTRLSLPRRSASPARGLQRRSRRAGAAGSCSRRRGRRRPGGRPAAGRRWPASAGAIRTPCARSDFAAGPSSFSVVESPARERRRGRRATATAAIAAVAAMPPSRVAAGSRSPEPHRDRHRVEGLARFVGSRRAQALPPAAVRVAGSADQVTVLPSAE